MASMSRMLRSDDDMNDVIAYINSLSNLPENKIAAISQGEH
jgi:hypothetical protein